MGTLNKVRESCQGVLGVETLDIIQGKRTICRITRGNLFMLTNITNTIIAITADSENGHDDAGQGKLCVESWKRERTI